MKKKIKKKILIIGSKEFFSLENMYLRAFKSLGCYSYIYHVYDIRKNLVIRFFWKYLRFIIFFFIRIKINNFFKKSKIKYDLVIIFKGLYLNKTFLLNLKKISKTSKWINIFPDDPFNVDYFKDISNNNVLKTLKNFDHFFIWSEKILIKLSKIIPKHRIHYLPFAYDQFIHKRYNKKLSKKFDLSFIGTADIERFNIINKLSKYKIIIAGDGWNEYKLSKNVKYVGKANTLKSSKIISNSKVSLNILRKQNKGSHNMKTFEIPSMGGLMLTDRTKVQNNFFPENKASLMYKDVNELLIKLALTNKNPSKLEKISNKGFIMSKKHSYKNRARFILRKIF